MRTRTSSAPWVAVFAVAASLVTGCGGGSGAVSPEDEIKDTAAEFWEAVSTQTDRAVENLRRSVREATEGNKHLKEQADRVQRRLAETS
jgi:hypothetical protein